MQKLIVLLLTIVLASCAVARVKVPEVSSGSKSDGVVSMVYHYGLFEKPQIDWVVAQSKALKYCGGWGYSDALKFGMQTKRCVRYSYDYGCELTEVVIKYQCTNSL